MNGPGNGRNIRFLAIAIPIGMALGVVLGVVLMNVEDQPVFFVAGIATGLIFAVAIGLALSARK